MAILYQLGAFTFDVFPVNVEAVERQVGADYAAKDIVGAMRPREFTGEADDRVKLSGRLFPQRLGGAAGIGALQALARTGEPQLLLRGDGEVLGWYLIEQVTDKHSFLDVAGMGRMIELDVELVKTPLRASASGMIATIASLFG
jgi:phage protein U